MGRSADARFDEAGRVHGEVDGLPARRHRHAARRKGRRAVAGAFREGREPEPEVAPRCPCLRLARAEGGDIDRGDGGLHALHVARLIEGEAGRGDVGKFPDQVAAADGDGVDRENRCRLVHQPFQRKRDHRPRYAAIGRHRAGIRGDAAGAAGVFAHVIGAGEFRHRHQRLDPAGGRIAGIGADIGDDVRFERDEPRLFVEAAFEQDVLVAAVIAGDEVLAAVLAPRDARAQPLREPRHQHEFRAERHFLAEPAADIRCDDAQARFRDTEHVGDRGAHEMRHLGRAGERDAIIGGVIGGMRRARLHRRGVLPARAQRDLHAACRRRGVEARSLHAAFDDDVPRGACVDRVRIEGRDRIDERRRFLDLDHDLVGRHPPPPPATAPPPRRRARRRTARRPWRASAGRSARS